LGGETIERIRPVENYDTRHYEGLNGVAEIVRQFRGTSVNQVAGVDHALVTAGAGVPTGAAILSRLEL